MVLQAAHFQADAPAPIDIADPESEPSPKKIKEVKKTEGKSEHYVLKLKSGSPKKSQSGSPKKSPMKKGKN